MAEKKDVKISDGQLVRVVEKISRLRTTFAEEFKKQTTLAITAAFGFLIALVWRDYITSLIKTEEVGFYSAVLVTVICVVGLIIISKWASSAPVATEEKK